MRPNAPVSEAEISPGNNGRTGTVTKMRTNTPVSEAQSSPGNNRSLPTFAKKCGRMDQFQKPRLSWKQRTVGHDRKNAVNCISWKSTRSPGSNGPLGTITKMRANAAVSESEISPGSNGRLGTVTKCGQMHQSEKPRLVPETIDHRPHLQKM